MRPMQLVPQTEALQLAMWIQNVIGPVLLFIASAALDGSNLEYQLTEESCRLATNDTLKQRFQRAVRNCYLNATSNLNTNRYTKVQVNSLGSIKCFSSCAPVSRISVTWCVHIYHLSGEVKACFNSSGLVSQTPLAASLNLDAQFSICDNAGTLCSTSTPPYMNRAYLVCTTRNKTCSDRTFIELHVDSSSPNARITYVTFSPTNVRLRTQAVLQCHATVSSAKGSITWSNGTESYYQILEDPFCVDSQNITCPRDTAPQVRIERLKRVRAYTTFPYDPNPVCGWKRLNMVGYLLISNVTDSDRGLYYCNASTELVTPTAMKSANVFLDIDHPPQLPIQPQNATVPTGIFGFETFSPKHPGVTSSGFLAVWSSLPIFIMVTLMLIISTLLVTLLRKKRKFRKRVEMTNFVIHEQGFYRSSKDFIQKEIATLAQHPDPWEFPRENLLILQNMLLGKGEYGQVYKGRALGIIPNAPDKDVVAIKMVKDSDSFQEIKDLCDEMQLMKKMQPHENILNLLGYCTIQGAPLCLIIEYAMHGSLRSFLNSCEEAVHKLNHQPIITRKRSRLGSSSSTSSTHHLLSSRIPTSAHTPSDSQTHFTFPPVGTSDGAMPEEYRVAHAGMAMTPFAHTVAPISTDYINCRGLIQMEDVQNFALQIASGLKHLEAMNIVHCDLAARNILIAEGFVLKICDFGMARDISEKEYYRKSPKGRIPVKWTAPEALEEHLYTFKSDIWSFGIVLWEIFTYGHSPYPDIEIQAWEHFIQFLKDGNRPPLPSACPEKAYDIMQNCWKLNPDQRPSSSDLIQLLIPKWDKEAPHITTSLNGSTQLEQVQNDQERYIVH